MRSRLFPGDRRVWLVAAAFGALLLVALLVTLLGKRTEPYTGTNSVIARGILAEARAGEKFCIPALNIPPGTHRIQVQAGGRDGRSARPALVAEITGPDGGVVESRRIAPAARPGIHALDIPVTPPRGDGPQVAGLCMTPSSGRLTVGGMLGVYNGDPTVTPTIDGRYTPGAAAVWYLPEAGSERTLLSLLPNAFARAAVFRPGPVGPWTYWIVFLVVVPLVLYASVRLLARAAAGESSRLRGGLAVALIAFANAAIWAFVTPVFDAPDEYDHVGYAQYLAETGHAPERGGTRPPWSAEESLALDEARPLSYIEVLSGRPRWLAEDEDRWAERQQELEPSRSNGGGNTTASTHAPLYYGALAPAYHAGGVAGGSIFTRITLMRLVSALFCAIVALCAYGVVRELVPGSRGLAVAAGLIVAFHPMLTFMGGAVNNDMGVNAAAAIVVYLVVRGLRRGLTVRTGIALGAAIVALPLMKATGLTLLPAVGVALLAMLWRRHSRADLKAYAALAGAFAAVALLWALVAPVFDRGLFATPGGQAPLASGGVGQSALSNPGGYLSYVWQIFFPRLPSMTDLHLQSWPARDIYVERGWAAFGWYTVKFQDWVYSVIAGAMIATLVLALVALWRERVAAIRRGPEIVVLVLVILGVIFGVHAAYYTPVGGRPVVAEQGRYAFLAMAALAPIVIAAAFAFGRRLATYVATGIACGSMGLWVMSQVIAVRGFFT